MNWKSELVIRLLFLVAATLAVLIHEVRGHDIYDSWRTRSGGSCCNGKDCQVVKYEVRGDGLWLLLGNRWWKASEAVATKVPSVDQDAHACFMPYNENPFCYAEPQWSG